MPLRNAHISPAKFFILTVLFMVSGKVPLHAQRDAGDTKYWYKNISYYVIDSNGVTFYYNNRVNCKSLLTRKTRFAYGLVPVAEKKPSAPIPQVPFLQLHGNMSYTVDYRSRLDTPFAASNLQQHNEQVYADAVFKGRYPFRIVINSRQSNSPFFKNYTDVNVQFNHQAFQQNIKQQMIAAVTQKLQLPNVIARYEAMLNKQRDAYTSIKNWVDDPARMQEIVQEKEQGYGKYLQGVAQNAVDSSSIKKDILKEGDSSKTSAGIPHNPWTQDSLMSFLAKPTSVERKMESQRKALDSLTASMLALQHREDSLKAMIGSDVADQTNKIRSASSIKELEYIEKKSGTSTLSKSDKNLLAITQFGIGRSSLNYSELTVTNVSLNGVNVEYNPSFYAAFAAGSVDYLFRDFVLQPGNMPTQKLVLGRFGWGDKEKQVFIFTAYTGTKNSFGGNIQDTSSFAPQINSIRIFGYSMEAKYKIDQNTNASFEFAKSSSPYTQPSDKTRSLSDAFSFASHHNEAWSAKVDIAIPSTESTINLFYKRIGANFQSYSIYNTGNQQEAWGIKWRQYLFKDQLSLTAQLKKSSIDNPFIPLTYNSAVVFKSIQAVYRKRKWPIFSVGYMPTTQLIKNSDGYLYQSVYYALTGSVFYNYTLLKLGMTSSLMYSRFYNKGTDSGFILYNAQNILYSHNIDLGKWHSQTDAQYTEQPGLVYWTFQQRVDVQVANCLTVGVGIKNNVLPATNIIYWGGSAQMDLRIKQLGGLRLEYDKGYLPDGFTSLVPNNWGRAMWYTVF